MAYSNDLGGYLIDISTLAIPVINGRHTGNEYIVVRNDHVQLVRLEDDKGKLVQNSYEYPNSQIGPIPDAISIEDWRALLESSEPSDVLSALVFLGGTHFQRNPFPENIAHESSAQVQRYKGAIGDQQIWALITKLESSDNKWVSEAAERERERERASARDDPKNTSRGQTKKGGSPTGSRLFHLNLI